jgi:ABC-type lipoprotein release transport system permease subunit
MQVFGVLMRLAWRNLWRNHRAITLGVWAMIFMTALMRGMVTQMVEDGISALPGHVQVHHPEYRDDPSIARNGQRVCGCQRLSRVNTSRVG